MKLLFKQHFSLLDNYSIYDEFGNTVFTVKSEFSFGHKLHIFNNYGEEVGMLVQKLLHLHPTFEVWVNGEILGTIRKNFTLFTFSFDLSFGNYHVEGNFMEWTYSISSGGKNIASVFKQIFKLTDTYVIDIADDSHIISAIMIVLAIDAAKCGK